MIEPGQPSSAKDQDPPRRRFCVQESVFEKTALLFAGYLFCALTMGLPIALGYAYGWLTPPCPECPECVLLREPS